MDTDAEHFYWGGLSHAGGKFAFSIFLFSLFTGLIIALPSASLLSSTYWYVLVTGLALTMPLLFGRYVIPIFSNLSRLNSPAIRMAVNVIVVIFLATVQLLVVIQITDFIIAQFYSGSHFTILSVMIVAAGIYTMAGGLVAVTYVNIIVSVLALCGVAAIVVNDVVFHLPLLFSIQALFSFGSEIFRSAGLSENNGAIVVPGILMMMLWMVWMNIEEFDRTVSAGTRNQWTKNLALIGIILWMTITVILYFAVSSRTASPDGVINSHALLDHTIGLGLLMGLMGILSIVFQKIGTIVAVRLYPSLRKKVGDEEKILVGRMTTVFVVLLSIIFISFSEISKYHAILWYISYIAFFFTPVMATLLMTSLFKKGVDAGCIFGIVAGELYAIFKIIGFYAVSRSSFLGSASPYAFAIDIAVVTVIAGTLSSWLSEAAFVQRAVSKIKLFVVR
jgi:SSS family solute:Na+ symporter